MPPTTSIQKIGFGLPCKSGIPLAKVFPHGSADKHDLDFVNTYLFPMGLEKVFTRTPVHD